MNAPFTFLLSWWLLGAALGQSPDLSGVYVNKEKPYYGIEFLSGGGCVFSGAFGRHGLGGPLGTYTREKDALVCRQGDEERTRLHWESKTLVDQNGNPWVPREEVVKMPWSDLRPVTVVVLDSETRKPITKFSYTYEMSAPAAKYDPMLVRPMEVHSESGSFALLAPQACQIEMEIGGENLLSGYGTWGAYNLTSDNKARRDRKSVV
jgi:hypothetical protein